MLAIFQKIKDRISPKVVLTPGLLSVYLYPDKISLSYAKNKDQRHVISIMEQISLTETDIETILKEFIERHDLPNVECILVLNPADYRLIYLDAPNVADHELGGAAKWLVKEFINFPLSNAAVDAFRVPVRTGQSSKMYAVVAQLDRLQTLLAAFEAAHIRVIAVDIAELALRNLMHLMEADNTDVGLVFMRPDFHAILISSNNTLCFSRMIESAAQYKQPGEAETPSREGGIQHLVTEIERSVNYYQSNIGTRALGKLWVLTSLDNQEEVVSALSSALPIPCETLDLGRYFQADSSIDLSQGVFGGISLGGLLRQELA